MLVFRRRGPHPLRIQPEPEEGEIFSNSGEETNERRRSRKSVDHPLLNVDYSRSKMLNNTGTCTTKHGPSTSELLRRLSHVNIHFPTWKGDHKKNLHPSASAVACRHTIFFCQKYNPQKTSFMCNDTARESAAGIRKNAKNSVRLLAPSMGPPSCLVMIDVELQRWWVIRPYWHADLPRTLRVATSTRDSATHNVDGRWERGGCPRVKRNQPTRTRSRTRMKMVGERGPREQGGERFLFLFLQANERHVRVSVWCRHVSVRGRTDSPSLEK